jgi:hypothetical protein
LKPVPQKEMANCASECIRLSSVPKMGHGAPSLINADKSTHK